MAMRIDRHVVRGMAISADAAASDVAKAHGKEPFGGASCRYSSMYARDDTDGTVYVASHREIVWRGRNAARRAAAYYLGVVDAFKGNAYLDLPGGNGMRRATAQEFPRVRDALFMIFTGEIAEEYGRGLDEGNYYRSRILA